MMSPKEAPHICYRVTEVKRSLTRSLKVAFIQKGLMPLSFLQTDEPNYFPELEF